jgi:hypothetical protein
MVVEKEKFIKRIAIDAVSGKLIGKLVFRARRKLESEIYESNFIREQTHLSKLPNRIIAAFLFRCAYECRNLFQRMK